MQGVGEVVEACEVRVVGGGAASRPPRHGKQEGGVSGQSTGSTGGSEARHLARLTCAIRGSRGQRGRFVR